MRVIEKQKHQETLRDSQIGKLTRELLREAFKNKNDETYEIFHMLVDPLPPPNIWKIYHFLLSKMISDSF